jgi:hypothetical protein
MVEALLSVIRDADARLGRTKEFPHAFLGPPVEAPTFNATS